MKKDTGLAEPMPTKIPSKIPGKKHSSRKQTLRSEICVQGSSPKNDVYER